MGPSRKGEKKRSSGLHKGLLRRRVEAAEYSPVAEEPEYVQDDDGEEDSPVAEYGQEPEVHSPEPVNGTESTEDYRSFRRT